MQPTAPQSPFLHARARFRIGSVDDIKLGVDAQFNPKEIQINQPVGWEVHQPIQNQSANDLFQEFKGMQAQTMQVELLFDFEQSRQPVMDRINILKRLAAVRDADSTDPAKCRPHFCIASWGEKKHDNLRTGGDFPSLRCVIESLATKYQMFSSTGEVMRASCTVSLREADLVGLAKREEQARERRKRG